MLINSFSSNPKLSIGLMSGTSLDGVDATLLRTDGNYIIEFLANLYLPYSGELISQLRELLFAEKISISRIVELQYTLTLRHIAAIQQLLQDNNKAIDDIDVIGMHGHTLYHAPEFATSWQLGLPDLVAQHTCTDVVFNFRNKDVAKGGQGAPLVPVFHHALLQNKRLSNAAILNIGGITNITISADDRLYAADIGPGNQLINDLCAEHFNIDYDHEGQIASEYIHDQVVVDQIMHDQFFKKNSPKSLDRSYFSRYKEYFLPLSPGVAIATATHLTVQSVLHFISNLDPPLSALYLCGGGAKNKYLISVLRDLLDEVVHIELIDQLGYNADFIESGAFAYLAVRNINKQFSTLSTTTGAIAPTIVGDVIHP